MNSDDLELAELNRDLEKRRAAMVPFPARVTVRIPKPMDPEREAELEQRKAEAELAARRGRIHGYLADLERIRGSRYSGCRLSNFEAVHTAQINARQMLFGYIEDLEANVVAGLGVFLFGPCGTGKDHLAMAIARAFIVTTAKHVAWSSGALLFEALRDSFDGKKTEGEVLGPYARAPMLWLSDPLPSLGELKEYKAEALYRLIDGRYSAKLPTIVTANLEPGAADAELTPAIARRLRESTLAIHCNWPAHRR